MSRTPTLSEVILSAIEQVIGNVHTAMPGRIESYDQATQLAKVKPLFKRKYAAEDGAVELPIISNVPVIFPRSANAFVRLPVAAGDFVQLLFNERSLDRWLDAGKESDPLDPSKFDLNGAVAVLGLYPKGEKFAANGDAGSLELANGQTYIEIKESGEVVITNGDAVLQIEGGNVKIQATKITLESSNVNLGDEAGEALVKISELSNLQVVGVQPGAGTLPVTSLPPAVGTQKVKAS